MNRPDTDAQDQLLQIITFGLQRAAGPYRRATSGTSRPGGEIPTLRYLSADERVENVVLRWVPSSEIQGDDQSGCLSVSVSSVRPSAGGYRPKFNSKSLETP